MFNLGLENVLASCVHLCVIHSTTIPVLVAATCYMMAISHRLRILTALRILQDICCRNDDAQHSVAAITLPMCSIRLVDLLARC